MIYCSDMFESEKMVFLLFASILAVLPITNADNTRIVGGADAKAGEFPYQVALKKNVEFFCGGSIISNEWILTAAHCLHNQTAKEFTVVVGSIYLYFSGTKYDVEKFIIHESFDKSRLRNDIGLIKLKEKITFGEEAAIVSLATLETPVGSTAMLSGWGMTKNHGLLNPVNLKKLKMVTISLEECKAKIPYGEVDESNICAFIKNGEGACFGDSGGPLVGVDSREQIGVVSWGDPCANGFPDVFTNVSYYKEWISTNIK